MGPIRTPPCHSAAGVESKTRCFRDSGCCPLYRLMPRRGLASPPVCPAWRNLILRSCCGMGRRRYDTMLPDDAIMAATVQGMLSVPLGRRGAPVLVGKSAGTKAKLAAGRPAAASAKLSGRAWKEDCAAGERGASKRKLSARSKAHSGARGEAGARPFEKTPAGGRSHPGAAEADEAATEEEGGEEEGEEEHPYRRKYARPRGSRALPAAKRGESLVLRLQAGLAPPVEQGDPAVSKTSSLAAAQSTINGNAVPREATRGTSPVYSREHGDPVGQGVGPTGKAGLQHAVHPTPSQLPLQDSPSADIPRELESIVDSVTKIHQSYLQSAKLASEVQQLGARLRERDALVGQLQAALHQVRRERDDLRALVNAQPL